MNQIRRNPAWIARSILVGAGFFIFALILSAVFDPKIRMLHALQALIYVAVIVRSRRSSAWGFGAGAFIAALWNYTNICLTSFVKDGLEQLSILIQKGHLKRPDLLVAVIAAGGHFLLIAACLAGFLRVHPSARQWGRFVGGGAIAIAYFVAIIITTGPQHIPLVKRVFGL